MDRTIDRGGDGALRYGPGEPYAVRTDLAEALAGREDRRRSLIVFHHFSDFRIVDEESPLRSEWVDSCQPAISTSAFRPQEVAQSAGGGGDGSPGEPDRPKPCDGPRG